MRKSWKIVIIVCAVVLIGFVIYTAIPRQQPQPAAESPQEPAPQRFEPPAPVKPLQEEIPSSAEIPYIHGATGMEGLQEASGESPGEYETTTLPGHRPMKSAPGLPGEAGAPTQSEGWPGPSASFDAAGLQGLAGTIAGPGGGLTTIQPGQPGAGPSAAGPETGIPLPPSGTMLPSLDEPLPGEEQPAEPTVPQFEPKRMILPPIISDDLLSTVLGERKFTLVYADRIDSHKQEDVTELHGNVRIQYKDNVIQSQEAIINREEDWAHFFGEGGVFAKNDDGELRCDELKAYFEDKIANLYGPVDVIRYANTEDELEPLPDDATRREKIERALKKKETHITCYDAEYDWGEKIGDLHNGVRIEQEDKYVECDELYFERKIDYALLTGDVELHQDNGRWLFDEKVITDEDKKVTQVVAKEKTTVYCDELETKGEDDWYQLRNNVHGVQPDKEGKCDVATMDDSEEVHLLTLDRNVWLHQSNGDWLFEAEVIDEDESEDVQEDARKWATLTCDVLLVHTDTEDAEATGDVFIEQEHQNGKSDKAFYLREHDLIHLVGNVEVQRKEKNTVFAEEAFLFMTSRIFEARGDVRTTAWVDVEEERHKREEEEAREEGATGQTEGAE